MQVVVSPKHQLSHRYLDVISVLSALIGVDAVVKEVLLHVLAVGQSQQRFTLGRRLQACGTDNRNSLGMDPAAFSSLPCPV